MLDIISLDLTYNEFDYYVQPAIASKVSSQQKYRTRIKSNVKFSYNE